MNWLYWFACAMLLFMLFEALLYRPLLKKSYPWREGLSSIVVTIGNQLSGVIYGLIPTYVFSYFFEHRLFDFKLETPLEVFGLFLFVDFGYYWGHRLAHHVRWMWASHSVHHSPNHITLATSYQLAPTAWLSGEWLLWIPWIILGADYELGLQVMGISLLYQFWLHTELVPRTPWLGLLFNNPSDHRVHHGANPEYINKNFGGVLIVWDRLFGTYQAELKEVPVRYGLTIPVRSLNPITVSFHYWMILFRDIHEAKGLCAKLRTAFEDPAAADYRKIAESVKDHRGLDVSAARAGRDEVKEAAFSA